MRCKKCEALGTVLLRRKDHYCENCFTTNINHKFRASIGKHRVISPNEQVLVCLSGGPSSTVLLDMVYNGITLNSHKKLRIAPNFVHVIDNINNRDAERTANAVINQCKAYDFKVYVIHISAYVKEHTVLPETNNIPANTYEADFQAMLSSMPATVINDFTIKIKHNLFIRIAELLQCYFIFTAETTATLAINLLSNLAVGRGAQVQNDVSFCDGRNDKIKILRPMKDISTEELVYYIKIKELNPSKQTECKQNSLHSVISTFVTDLQDSFPATISTICKTADKIGTCSEDGSDKKCGLCKSDLMITSSKLTALEATNFSRVASLHNSRNVDLKNMENQANHNDEKSMLPFVNDRLCYSCNRNYLEIDHYMLPQYLRDAIQS